MRTFTFEIDDEAAEHWQKLARAAGKNLEHLMRQAIANCMEDLEDHVAVKDRLKRPYKTLSNDEVWEALGLGERVGGDSKVASRSAGRSKAAGTKAAASDPTKRRRTSAAG